MRYTDEGAHATQKAADTIGAALVLSNGEVADATREVAAALNRIADTLDRQHEMEARRATLPTLIAHPGQFTGQDDPVVSAWDAIMGLAVQHPVYPDDAERAEAANTKAANDLDPSDPYDGRLPEETYKGL